MNYNVNNYNDVRYDIEHDCPSIIIDEAHVRKLVGNIKTTKSSGIDGINSRVLKEALAVLIPQLCDIFRKSLDESCFPDSWSISTVVPIPKTGSLSDISNWRPINLLPIPGRILEKIVHSNILGHLRNNKILSRAQYDFRPGLGTGDAIFDFTN